jgi:predicted metal-dependent phosphoesterase TrpH
MDRTDRRGCVDLHIHTVHSDGVDTPAQVVERALDLGLAAISVTDHDTVSGISETVSLAKGTSLEVIPGVELSATDGTSDIHILGYFVDYSDTSFIAELNRFKNARLERAKKILGKLKEMNIDLPVDRVLDIANRSAIGRPHIAEALLDQGYVDTFEEAFRKYIGHRSPAYVPKLVLEPRQAFDLIRSVGGIAAMAHPGTVQRDDLIPVFVEQGMQALEVWHPQHDRGSVRYYMEIAKRYGIAVTGGSDTHGPRVGGSTVGSERVPASVADSLRELTERST